MNKVHTIIVLGIVVALTPYLGFPSNWKVFLTVFFGLLISLTAFLLIKEQGHRAWPPAETFAENNPDNKDGQFSQITENNSSENLFK